MKKKYLIGFGAIAALSVFAVTSCGSKAATVKYTDAEGSEQTVTIEKTEDSEKVAQAASAYTAAASAYTATEEVNGVTLSGSLDVNLDLTGKVTLPLSLTDANQTTTIESTMKYALNGSANANVSKTAMTANANLTTNYSSNSEDENSAKKTELTASAFTANDYLYTSKTSKTTEDGKEKLEEDKTKTALEDFSLELNELMTKMGVSAFATEKEAAVNYEGTFGSFAASVSVSSNLANYTKQLTEDFIKANDVKISDTSANSFTLCFDLANQLSKQYASDKTSTTSSLSLEGGFNLYVTLDTNKFYVSEVAFDFSGGIKANISNLPKVLASFTASMNIGGSSASASGSIAGIGSFLNGMELSVNQATCKGNFKISLGTTVTTPEFNDADYKAK